MPYCAIGAQYDMTSSAAGVEAVSSDVAVKTSCIWKPPASAWAAASRITGPSMTGSWNGMPISSTSADWAISCSASMLAVRVG